MTTLAIATESRVILDGVSWQTFECLLDDLGEHRKARLAYDQGMLEIMTPYFGHEWLNRLVADIITAVWSKNGNVLFQRRLQASNPSHMRLVFGSLVTLTQ